MSNLTHFNPFNELSRIDPLPGMGDLFKGFALRPILRDFEAEPQMKVEVSEDDKVYRVKAEVPGVKKEDIDVSVNGNRISISAEIREEKEEKKGEKVIRSERYYGKVSRSFTLDEEIDQGATQAKYTDGVLDLTLPKKPGTATKKITVS
ncbi:MAG TPA: Hsp20/alpha crystallin family protein [Gallionella sp.]|nr:Hsp20/alpha crystallin family protein [Gallionella sp.]